MNIYQIDFDYTFALADIRAAVDGADSMEFSQERPELIDKFKYDWVTTDSELIPDFVVIMSELLGCKTVVKFSNGDIMEITNPAFLPGDYPILFKVEDMSSVFFCSQEFKDFVEINSYTGLRFKECVVKSKSWF